MQLPWRSLHRPPARTPHPAWPPTATALLLALAAVGALSQWSLRRLDVDAPDPLLNGGALTLRGLRAGHAWQLVTHLFLPADPAALLPFSLLTLGLAGRPLEGLVGRRHLWQLFGLAGVLGGLGQIGFDTLLGRSHPVAGSSSAAMGCLLALTCVSPKAPLLPWAGEGAWKQIKVMHGTLGALAATVAAGTHSPAAGALVGGLTGCLYMHVLGFGGRAPEETVSAPAIPAVSPASSASWPEHGTAPPPPDAASGPRFTDQEREMTAREFIVEKIDPVLDKINRQGLASLTSAERQLLAKACEKMMRGC